MNSKGLAQLAYEKGMYVLTAAQSYQAAQEATQLGHGFLTYALVEEGLKTAIADAEPKDNRLLLREWLNYATNRVPQMQQDMIAPRKWGHYTLCVRMQCEGSCLLAPRRLKGRMLSTTLHYVRASEIC